MLSVKGHILVIPVPGVDSTDHTQAHIHEAIACAMARVHAGRWAQRNSGSEMQRGSCLSIALCPFSSVSAAQHFLEMSHPQAVLDNSTGGV